MLQVEPTQAVLRIEAALAGSGFATVRPKTRSAVAPPPLRFAIVKEQELPAAGEAQVQAGSLAAAEKVVFAGTVSERATPVAA